MYQMPRTHSSRGRRRRQSESGQLVVEYILLLVVALGAAILITNLMVSRGDTEGFLISSWKALLTTIASDKADGIDP